MWEARGYHAIDVHGVVHEPIGTVQRRARHPTVGASRVYLLAQVGCRAIRVALGLLAETVERVADEQLCLRRGVLGEPFEAGQEPPLRAPIELWDDDIAPALGGPQGYVGVHRVVVVLIVALRRDGEHGVWSYGLYGVVHRHDERVDHGAAELGYRGEALAIASVFGLVPHLLALLQGGVEIVVEVYAVHVVASQQVGNYCADPLPGLRHGGVVDPHHAVVFHETLRYPAVELAKLVAQSLLLIHAVGVYPRVKRHAAAMRLVDDPSQHVVGRCLAAIPRHVLAPRLIGRVVEGIGLGAHLEKHRVDVELLQRVEHLLVPCLLRSLCEAATGPVDAAYRGDPHGACLLAGHDEAWRLGCGALR